MSISLPLSTPQPTLSRFSHHFYLSFSYHHSFIASIFLSLLSPLLNNKTLLFFLLLFFPFPLTSLIHSFAPFFLRFFLPSLLHSFIYFVLFSFIPTFLTSSLPSSFFSLSSQLIQNATVMGALTRVLQEEFKKSTELTFNILRCAIDSIYVS